MKRYLKVLLFPLVLLCEFAYADNQSGKKVDFSMLPAVVISEPTQSVLLDLAKTQSRTVAVGEYGLIIYSDDGGKNWKQAQSPVSVTITSVFFLNDELGWATGHQGVILHTQNGGESWQRQLNGHQATEIILKSAKVYKQQWEQALASNKIPAGLSKDDFALQIDDLDFLIEDKERALADGPSEPFFDIWFSSPTKGYAIGAYGFLFNTTDGGKNWNLDPSYLTNVDKFHFYTLVPFDQNQLFLIGESGLVWRSNNAGETWSKVETPYDGSFFGGLKTKDDALVIYGLRGNIFKTKDLGQTWSRTKTDHTSSIMGSAQLDANRIVFVGTDGALLVSEDNGGSADVYALPKRSTNTAITTLPTNLSTETSTLTIVGKQGLQTHSLEAVSK